MRDATRHLLFAAGLVGAIAIAVTAVGGNRKVIEKVRAESRVLELQRDSLMEVIAQRETARAQLAARADTLETEADLLRDSVDRMERQRAQAQLGVRQIRTVGALQTRLRYQDLSARYVAELRKPRITLGRSISLIAAAGAGFVLARATHE